MTLNLGKYYFDHLSIIFLVVFYDIFQLYTVKVITIELQKPQTQ